MGYHRPCLCLKVVSFRANVIFLASFFKDDRCYWRYFSRASSSLRSIFGARGRGRARDSWWSREGRNRRRNQWRLKVARYSFSGPIPPRFEHKLRRLKQSFGKIATTVILDKDENLLWSGLQRHRSCHSNEMALLPILLAAVYLSTGNCSSKLVHGSFFLQ